MWLWFAKLGSPKWFYELSGKWLPWLVIAMSLLVIVGVIWALVFVPPDYQQGNTIRIMYIHVPFASISLAFFPLMAVAGTITLVWRMKLADMVAKTAAPLGAWFTFLALATGSIWGRPMWGTWWEWGDPRLTSELLMLFLYFGYMALRAAIDDTAKADRASAVLALVGAVNIPIIPFSVEWWSSLHQGPTIIRAGGPAIEPAMLYPLLAMIFGFSLLFGALLLSRVRTEVLYRERRARWVRNLLLPSEETA